MKYFTLCCFLFFARSLEAQSIDLSKVNGNDTISIRAGAKITFPASTKALPNLVCVEGKDPTAMFVAGFGIDTDVSVLPMAPGGGGVLPADLPVVPTKIKNTGKASVPAGYIISFKLYAMTFLAVNGSAGYSRGSLVASATMGGPALAPGDSAALTLPTTAFKPSLPSILPCGLYELVMTIDTANAVIESNERDNVCVDYLYAPGVGQPFTFVWKLTDIPGQAACAPATPGAVQVIAEANAAGVCAGIPPVELPNGVLAPGWCPQIATCAVPCPGPPAHMLPPPVAYLPPGNIPCWVQVTITPPAGLTAGTKYHVGGKAETDFQNTCDQPLVGGKVKYSKNGIVAPATWTVNCVVGGNDCSIQTFPPQDCVFSSYVMWTVTAVSADGCVITTGSYTQYVTHRGG